MIDIPETTLTTDKTAHLKPREKTPSVVVADPNKVIDNWAMTKSELDKIKKEEELARKKVIDLIKAQAVIGKGTNRFSTGSVEIKMVTSIAIEIATDWRELDQVLQAIAGIYGSDVASSLVTWKPSLNKKAYDNLSEDGKKLLSPLLVKKERSPTLSVEV